jgi:hypothetical protein
MSFSLPGRARDVHPCTSNRDVRRHGLPNGSHAPLHRGKAAPRSSSPRPRTPSLALARRMQPLPVIDYISRRGGHGALDSLCGVRPAAAWGRSVLQAVPASLLRLALPSAPPDELRTGPGRSRRGIALSPHAPCRTPREGRTVLKWASAPSGGRPPHPAVVTIPFSVTVTTGSVSSTVTTRNTVSERPCRGYSTPPAIRSRDVSSGCAVSSTRSH